MTREEKLRLNRERQQAVKDAWAREQELINQGKGTVDWTPEQQKELMEKGRVSGYEGQHMKSVHEYPEYAGCVDNIQLLSHEDHLAAHNCSGLSENKGYHSPTNGYYDAKAKTMHSFGDNAPKAPEAFELSNPICHENGKDKNIAKQDRIKDQKSISKKREKSILKRKK